LRQLLQRLLPPPVLQRLAEGPVLPQPLQLVLRAELQLRADLRRRAFLRMQSLRVTRARKRFVRAKLSFAL
jgi:hypothetical protein